jgi:hypothetical protein
MGLSGGALLSIFGFIALGHIPESDPGWLQWGIVLLGWQVAWTAAALISPAARPLLVQSRWRRVWQMVFLLAFFATTLLAVSLMRLFD